MVASFSSHRTKHIPLVLASAISRLSSIRSALNAYRNQSIRKERLDAVQRVCLYLLSRCSLQHGGSILRKHDNRYYHVTLQRIADDMGMGLRRVKRCIQDLTLCGFLMKGRQAVRLKHGVQSFSSIRRAFTAFFWRFLGLEEQYAHDMDYAKKKAGRDDLTIYPVVKSINTRSDLTGSEVQRQLRLLADMAMSDGNTKEAALIRSMLR